MEEVPVDVFTRDGNDEDHELLFERLTNNVEKDGRPFNWLTSEEEVEQERERRQKEKFMMDEEKICQEKTKLEMKESDERALREKAAKDRMAKLQEEERDALNNKSLALRNFLNDNVIPTLTEGLIETCKILPDDPLD